MGLYSVMFFLKVHYVGLGKKFESEETYLFYMYKQIKETNYLNFHDKTN